MNQLLKKYSVEIEQILSKYPEDRKRAAVMPLLHLAQSEFGFVSRAAMQEIAEITEIAVTEVASVVGFYTLFHDAPQGKIRLQVCTDVACDLRGAKQYLSELCEQLGVQPGGTSEDGLITIEEVKCLAACDKTPLFQAQMGDEVDYHENQTAARTVDWLRSMSAAINGTPLKTTAAADDRPEEEALMSKLILLRHREIPGLNQLKTYLSEGGFAVWKKAVTTLKPEDMVNEVKASGLRGRGGAGFPTGVKWSFLPNTLWPHYVVANSDESEPGTFKDRELLELNPYQFLEGLMLTSFAVQANDAYIYFRGEFAQIARKFDERIAELTSKGYLGDALFGTRYSLRIHTHLGAGAYICGEETALLESIEGRIGQPRLRPPFPAVAGLFDKPTVINNVETLANIPFIIEHGSDAFRENGTDKSPGTKIFSLSGRVKKPGNYELPLGTTFRELIFQHGEGIIDDAPIKAIMPAGASSTLIPATEAALDTPMEYESTAALGAPLGSASVIVLDETVNISRLVHSTTHFFKHESCGKCTPCREGTYWMSRLTDRIEKGTAKKEDIDLLKAVANQMQNKCFCALGEFSTMAVISGINHFRADFEARLER